MKFFFGQYHLAHFMCHCEEPYFGDEAISSRGPISLGVIRSRTSSSRHLHSLAPPALAGVQRWCKCVLRDPPYRDRWSSRRCSHRPDVLRDPPYRDRRSSRRCSHRPDVLRDPPYRDRWSSRRCYSAVSRPVLGRIVEKCGLSTPLEVHSGLLDHRF